MPDPQRMLEEKHPKTHMENILCICTLCVVTGCTDGIGRSYTLELARHGLRKFILIGRNSAKLQTVVDALKQINKDIWVETLVFDFAHDDYAKMNEFLKEFDIGFLVNSVGAASPLIVKLCDQIEVNREIMKLNVNGTMEMLHACIPSMVQHGGGQCILVSSSLGYGEGGRRLAAYCASKATVNSIARAVGMEYGADNVNVQLVTPSLVATKMSKYDTKANMWVVSPDEFARDAVPTIGLVNETTGCFNHEFQMLLLHVFPWWLLRYLMDIIFDQHEKRLLKAAAEKNKDS